MHQAYDKSKRCHVKIWTGFVTLQNSSSIIHTSYDTTLRLGLGFRIKVRVRVRVGLPVILVMTCPDFCGPGFYSVITVVRFTQTNLLDLKYADSFMI